jgi:hypothetical protein
MRCRRARNASAMNGEGDETGRRTRITRSVRTSRALPLPRGALIARRRRSDIAGATLTPSWGIALAVNPRMLLLVLGLDKNRGQAAGLGLTRERGLGLK